MLRYILFSNVFLALTLTGPVHSALAQTDLLQASGFKTNASLAASPKQSLNHSTLLQLLQASGLIKQSLGKTPYTVFAPKDAALSVLPDGELQKLLLPSSKKRLVALLAYHVVKGRLTSDLLKDGQTLTTVTGNILIMYKQGNKITVQDGKDAVADVIQDNIRATNGVAYTINKVLQL